MTCGELRLGFLLDGSREAETAADGGGGVGGDLELRDGALEDEGTRITDAVDAVTHAHDALAPCERGADPRASVLRLADGVEHVENGARRPAVEPSLERADRGDDGRDRVRFGGRDDPRRERGGVHAVVDDRDEVGVERGDLGGGRDASSDHAEVVGGVREARVGADRRGLTGPGRGEHRDGGDDAHGFGERLLARYGAEMGDGGP